MLMLCIGLNLRAQIPAEVKAVMEKCNAAMDNPKGMEIDMQLHMGMAIVSANGFLKMYMKGEKMLTRGQMKALGQTVNMESGFDGVQEWDYESELGSKAKDTLTIKKVTKKSKGDFDLDFNLDKEYKTAKMKVVKNRFYEITFSQPLSKENPKTSVMVIDKNNFTLHEMRAKMGMASLRLTINKIKVGVADNVFTLNMARYPNAVVVRK